MLWPANQRNSSIHLVWKRQIALDAGQMSSRGSVCRYGTWSRSEKPDVSTFAVVSAVSSSPIWVLLSSGESVEQNANKCRNLVDSCRARFAANDIDPRLSWILLHRVDNLPTLASISSRYVHLTDRSLVYKVLQVFMVSLHDRASNSNEGWISTSSCFMAPP